MQTLQHAVSLNAHYWSRLRSMQSLIYGKAEMGAIFKWWGKNSGQNVFPILFIHSSIEHWALSYSLPFTIPIHWPPLHPVSRANCLDQTEVESNFQLCNCAVDALLSAMANICFFSNFFHWIAHSAQQTHLHGLAAEHLMIFSSKVRDDTEYEQGELCTWNLCPTRG